MSVPGTTEKIPLYAIAKFFTGHSVQVGASVGSLALQQKTWTSKRMSCTSSTLLFKQGVAEEITPKKNYSTTVCVSVKVVEVEVSRLSTVSMMVNLLLFPASM